MIAIFIWNILGIKDAAKKIAKTTGLIARLGHAVAKQMPRLTKLRDKIQEAKNQVDKDAGI